MAMTGARRVSTGLGLVAATPPEQLVDGAQAVKDRVSPDRRDAVTELVHWSIGAVGGTLYGLLPRALRRRRGVGPLYGLAIFAVFELFVQPALDTPHAEDGGARQRLAISADHVLYGLILAEPFTAAD